MLEKPTLPPMTAQCYCEHLYIAHVSLEFTNHSLECLFEGCDCRRFKWKASDRKIFLEPPPACAGCGMPGCSGNCKNCGKPHHFGLCL